MNKRINLDNLKSVEYQELERKRIANELHDTSLQDLTHLIHQIELANLYIDVDIIKAKLELEDVNNQLRKVIQDIRNTIFCLRPMSFDDLGLSDCIKQYIDLLYRRYSVLIESEVDDVEFLDENSKLIIYRIIQECLTNSAKHAEAKKVELKIVNRKNNIEICIKDDGVGIENKMNNSFEGNDHYGLYIIKERVSMLEGKISISSLDYNGTEIKILIPIKKGVLYED